MAMSVIRASMNSPNFCQRIVRDLSQRINVHISPSGRALM